MIRGAIYFDANSPIDSTGGPFDGVKYEVIDGTNVPDDKSIPVGDDSGSYTPASTDVIILSPRGNIKCWPVWSTDKWRFYVSDSDYLGYIFYTIHQEA